MAIGLSSRWSAPSSSSPPSRPWLKSWRPNTVSLTLSSLRQNHYRQVKPIYSDAEFYVDVTFIRSVTIDICFLNLIIFKLYTEQAVIPIRQFVKKKKI